MVYSLVSLYLTFYLTDVAKVPTSAMWWIMGIILAARVFDALNDPVMGLIVDNTRSRFGKFKPWIAFGAASSGVITVLLFCRFDFNKASGVALFGLLYVLWGMAFTTNDISYWSLLPTLSNAQKEREKIGSIARICANVGLFFIVGAITPLTAALGELFGGHRQGYFVFAIIVVGIMWAGQLVTLVGVKERKDRPNTHQTTSIKELVGIIVKNDQLLFTAISMSLFMIGYSTTTAFGQYFMKYAYGDEAMYPVFGIILGVSQVSALSVFPLLSKRMKRRSVYTLSMVLVAVGYILFFLVPSTSMFFIAPPAILIFVGQAFIQLLMLMFLADSVDYGHWKLGKRNDSITFSLQPFINKMGGAISSAVTSVVVIMSGIKGADSAADVSSGGIWMLKFAMLIFPMLCMVISFFVYNSKYKIDEQLYEKIVVDIEQREKEVRV
jgi:melibiose permease/lactose/raffinose/galactose permease